ncbi:helix-turn-helix domain-containing protein [Streptomyces sp. NPDC059037]|uniref:helix-turn-helix domain-containing protein n=1 Tax=Streptomyces sp. NPDC059037 TaxID=3346710 RepID=UPI00368884D2
MSRDFVRLSAELKAARERKRPKLTQPDAADALGIGRSTLQKIERNAEGATITTVRSYARLLGWSDDSVDRVLAGGSPVMASATEEKDEPSAAPALGLSPAVEYELRSGETLGSQVFNLGPDEEDGHIIVVLQGKKGASPEEVERVAARYRLARRRLQGIASDADETDADS